MKNVNQSSARKLLGVQQVPWYSKNEFLETVKKDKDLFWGICLHLTHDTDVAADLLQTVYVETLENYVGDMADSNVSNEATERVALKVVMINLIKENAPKRKGRAKVISLNNCAEEANVIVMDEKDLLDDVEELLMSGEGCKLISTLEVQQAQLRMQLINTLHAQSITPSLCKLFMLVLQGASIEDAMNEAHLKPGNIKNWLKHNERPSTSKILYRLLKIV
jgi:hypothetical protein